MPSTPLPVTLDSGATARTRVRLLPLLVGVMMLVLTIRVGDMWQHLSVGVGSETQAQSAPSTNAASTENAAPTQPATPGENASSPAVGAAAENATATEPAVPPPAKDPLEYTDEEIEVLQQLAKRREELELKSRQLDEREAMVVAAEQRMEQKMAELKALQSTVEALLTKRSDEEEKQLQTLVSTYEKMKPKDAAQVFEEMDMDLLADLVSRMKTSRAAPILALVSPTKVKELTFELAQQKTLPFAP
jgi:flagellar motility protein MotE (MotC chaperone)